MVALVPHRTSGNVQVRSDVPLAERPVRTAIVDTAPVLVGIIPFGMAIGIAVGESAVHDGAGWAGALLLFSASAHMAAVSILGAGGSAVAVLVAVLLINARLLVYSALLASPFRAQPVWFRWAAPYFVLDQSYALVSRRLEEGLGADWIRAYYLAMGTGVLLVWPSAVAVGVLAGPMIPGDWQLGLTAPLLLAGLLAPALKNKTTVLVGIVAATVAVAMAALPGGVAMLVGTFAGTAVGAWLGRRAK
jgi:predicted branched-subunit amino acid permease